MHSVLGSEREGKHVLYLEVREKGNEFCLWKGGRRKKSSEFVDDREGKKVMSLKVKEKKKEFWLWKWDLDFYCSW